LASFRKQDQVDIENLIQSGGAIDWGYLENTIKKSNLDWSFIEQKELGSGKLFVSYVTVYSHQKRGGIGPVDGSKSEVVIVVIL
jgi:hypothetical protein